jgi:hypothetical protein
MMSLIKSSFLWQFAAGFALGAIGLATLHPGDARADAAPTQLAAK